LEHRSGIERSRPCTEGDLLITQLNPPLPLHTPKGDGLAHFVIDYGPESDLLWVVFMNEDGACWSVPNPDVRMKFNWSMGRRPPKADDASPSTAPAKEAGGGRIHRIFDGNPPHS
jgi:hypothetical protein